MQKRGQLSAFIVVGVIILLGVLAYLYIEGRAKTEVIESPILPQELLPVKSFVEDCIAQTGREAVMRMGEQGGYLYFPDYIAKDPSAYMSPNGFTKIPFWFYLGKNRMPALLDMQEDLSRYMNEQLPLCLNEFVDFEQQFTIEPLAPISTLTTIAEDHVNMDVEYALRVERPRDRDEYFIKSFNINIPVRLKRAYDFAQLLLLAENTNTFLENITLDLMAMNPSIPFTGLDFSCSAKQWSLRTIRSELQETLESQMPLVRFKNTNHRPFLEDPSAYEHVRAYTIEDIARGNLPENVPADAYQYFHYFIDVTARDYRDLSANVGYDSSYGLDLQVRPSDGNVLRSSSGQGDENFLRFLCFQFHHFTYDLQYPVIISVRDDLSFAGDGYLLRFALPVQIIHNAPDRADKGSNFFSLPGTQDSCNNDGPEVDIRAKGRVNGFDNMDIDGVNFTYDCFSYRCELGTTRADGGIFRLRTNLPSGCSKGYLIAEKAGYLTQRAQLLDLRQNVELEALKTVNAFALKHSRSNLGSTKTLESWDSVVLSLRNDEEEFTAYAEITAQSPAQLELLAKDAQYVADIMLIDTLDDVIYGGFKGNITITEEMIGSGAITFHVIEQIPKPFNMEDSSELIVYLQEGSYAQALAPSVGMS